MNSFYTYLFLKIWFQFKIPGLLFFLFSVTVCLFVVQTPGHFLNNFFGDILFARLEMERKIPGQQLIPWRVWWWWRHDPTQIIIIKEHQIMVAAIVCYTGPFLNFWMMMKLARKRSLLCVAMATRLADRVCQQQQRGVMYWWYRRSYNICINIHKRRAHSTAQHATLIFE